MLSAVFEPEIDQTLARLRREERELEERLDEIRARRRSAAGDVAGPEERHEPASDRSLDEVQLSLFEEARP